MDGLGLPSDQYRGLYELQDQVLDIIFRLESEFYLTGGTCLSRFYQAKRYSDDLDLFTYDSPRFSFAVRGIRAELQKFFSIHLMVENKNFVRWVINDLLQVDFVNDSVYRDTEPVLTPKGYRIDTVENIASNKITAVLGRDNPKDVFDLILIYSFYSLDWSQILGTAHKKAFFATDDLVIRLSGFPKQLLQSIQCIDCAFLEPFEQKIDDLIRIVLESEVST